MSDGGAMQVDSEAELPSVAPSRIYTVSVLQVIKTAQAQHGGRYGDYQRYRYLHIVLFSAERAWSYAMELKQAQGGPDLARKRAHLIRRLSKAAKWGDLFARLCAQKGDSKTALEAEFLHGRGKYSKKAIEPSSVTDERYLHIVLFSAERAWSYAMELKQAQGGPDLARKRAHLIRRLSKAAKWGDLFARLCAQKGDSKTALEAELGKVGEVEQQVLCRQRVDELEPSIRYCKYKMGGASAAPGEGTDSLLQLSRDRDGPSPALDVLSSKLEQAGQDLEAELAKGPAPERCLSLYDKLFVTAGGAEALKEELTALDRAVGCLLLQRTMERNLLLVAVTAARLDRQQQGAAGGARAAAAGGAGSEERGPPAEKEKEKEKPAKPEDLNASDLSDAAASGREQQGEGVQFSQQLAAKRLSFQASRCFYVAQSYAAAAKYPEAYVVFDRAAQEAQEALQALQRLPSRPAVRRPHPYLPLATCLAAGRNIRVWQWLWRGRRLSGWALASWAHSDSAHAAAGVQKGVAALSVAAEASAAGANPKYLLEFLGEYRSAVGPAGSKQPPLLAQNPPPFRAVPCRPIVLDTALNTLAFPSLEGRTKKKEAAKAAASGGGIFGFFRR
eukprot:jgi/Mesen1/9056/ME000057S08475